jgi:DNA-binding transcriptional LysR family regulator
MARIGDRDQLEAFVRAVELGNLSAAARELDLMPSTLSKMVTRLEESLKVRLVTRTPRRIALTPEGERFLIRCRRILAELEDAEMEAGGSREKPRGRLRMHTGPGFGMGPLARELPRFLDRYPEVQLDYILDDRAPDLARENIDVSASVWLPQNKLLVVRDLFSFGRITAASPRYLKKNGVPRTPDDLLRHRCLRVASTQATFPWRFETPAGIRTLETDPSIVMNNAEQCLRFAIAGVGVIQMMAFQVEPYLEDGSLVRVLPGYPCPDGHTMRVLYPHERYRLPRVRAMIDFLFETFAAKKAARAPQPATGR